MVNHKKRTGRATSSQMHRLATSYRGPGKFIQKGQTYISELNWERKMKRSMDTEVNAQQMCWGKFGEIRVFDLIGLKYSMTNKMTEEHPEMPMYWSGTADLYAKDRRGEIKCFYPKKFAQLTDCIIAEDPEKLKNDCPEVYWQIVSNCEIGGVSKAEVISYMPYESEADAIHEMVSDPEWYTLHGLKPWHYRFIAEATDPDPDKRNLLRLPFLPDDSDYNNLNTFAFEIPMDDRVFLKKAMLEAIKLMK